MKKKIISILIILLVIGTFIVNHMITYATDATEPIYVGLAKINLAETGTKRVGYGNGNPTNGGKYIWNIITYDSKDPSAISTTQRNLYCVKADYGQTWFSAEDDAAILKYNLYYDMQSDRENLIANLQENVNDNTADDVIKALLTPGGGQYEQLLWLLDNAYITGMNVNEYLESVGIFSYEYEGETYYYIEENGLKKDFTNGEPLNEADIIAIQRMAIWYFTNKDNDIYDKTAETATQWLFITSDEGVTYNGLSTISESRNEMAKYLYDYLINGANEGKNQYKSENNYKIETAPVSVNTTGLRQDNNKYVVQTQRKGANYLIGPIVIDKNNDLGYDIAITVTDENNTALVYGTDYIYTDVNGTELKDIVGVDGGFYVSVSRSLVEMVNIQVKVSYNTVTKKLWLQGTEVKDENQNVTITLNGEQPLVEVIQDPQDIIVELTSKPEEFDLALRKYITAVHNEDGEAKTISNPRNLNNISLGTLLTGTTATYKHRKDPVIVEENDIVTYTIRIYNEGNKAGYATQIIDQLPEGLIRDNTITTVVSKDKNGNTKNTYTLENSTSLTTTNQIILTIVNTEENPAQSLNAYTTGSLDYETIEIKCKVLQKADTKNDIVLTNVAWIESAYNSEDQEEILKQGQDRDSEPQTSPSVNKNNMTDYRGSTTGNALTDSEFFYEGQQDDDDFEKLIIKAVPKYFDLALVKFIVAVSDDEKIEETEYLKESDGTYSRAPEVKYDSETGKIEYDFTNRGAKNPLVVEPGDYVLYTIRVYNEGELDGYASKIRDELPEGLEFVVGDTTYNGIWNIEKETLNNEDRVEVTTDWYAKGKSYETLLKAFNKESAISEENPDYLDAQVLCKVVEQATSDRVLVNYAQIADDSDENGEEIEDIDSTPDKWIDEDDDQDIEKIQLQYFDLSLRKFITSVNGESPVTSRIPVENVSNLKNRTDTTAIYNHPKTPLAVKAGDKIIYTIRVYNEGDINGYASEVTDYLPKYLTYVEDSEINKQYGWQISENGRIVKTTYLLNTELKAFDGQKLDHADLKIECIVSDEVPLNENQTNIAEISEYKYNGKTVENDIDSTADNMESADYLPTDEELPTYKDEEINNSYVEGNEDDDDFEKIYVQEFDLALRKFITKVQDKEITTREPKEDVTPLKNGEDTATYTHPKDALIVHVGDTVIYTLRIYNEGEIDGYASEITDDIPEYLEYLPEDSTNVEYMWKMYDKNGVETEKVEEAVKVTTTYLSKENGEDNLIKAFDGEKLSHKDIKIAFKVKDPNSNTYIITNHAQISNDTDENGNEIDDNDSITDIWNEGEDDQDIENVKVEYFDLSLLKFVSKVIIIEDGKEKITETGYNGHEDPEPVVKVELHKKKLNKVTVKFGYGITITNESDIPGYAKEITDYVPEGLKFDPTDNPEWTDEGNNVISTRQTEGILLQPGESTTVEVIFTWINNKDNLALKTNTAEISEDDNEYGVPDRDSTPDNKVDGEDDIDIAKVILAISTGATKTYFMLTLGLLGIVLVGVVLIKKFVI